MAATAERRFRAMGTDCHVVVVGGASALLEAAERRVADLEQRWSRFRPSSELSRLNASPGRVVVVSSETFGALSVAVEAWYLTAGRFDPTVLTALAASGYDRTFRAVERFAVTPVPEPDPAPGCAGIVLLPAARAVVLPPGVAIDLGGIGKGLAADTVATELVDLGAGGACVNLGGDVRVIGEPPVSSGWEIAIDDPFRPGTELTRVSLRDGAVVTTSRLTRRWVRGGRELHHLIDPTTGRPGAAGVAAVTVVAAQAAGGEALAKAAFLAGVTEGRRLVEAAALSGLLVDDHGGVHIVELEGFLA